MSTHIVAQQGDALLLAPVQDPILGWCIRPGTFRVAHPYDQTPRGDAAPDSLATGRADDPAGSALVTVNPRKKRKVASGEGIADEKDQELVEWMKRQLQDLSSQEPARALLEAMPKDYFYGTHVHALANLDHALDLVQFKPMLGMLRSGFASSNGHDDGNETEFDTLQLQAGYQPLDLADVYETLVTNDNNEPAIVSFVWEGQPHYLFPPRSGFVVSDLDRIHGLKAIAKERGGFDMIIMDPPWQNASVDRMSHFGTLDLYELFKIPIPELLKNDSGIVAVWITNRNKVKKVVVDKLFRAWGLDWVAHWYWLKVTTSGEPVLSFENVHRKPYEGILVGRRKPQGDTSAQIAPSSPSTSSSATVPEVNRKLIVSVPSQHSRKPSLIKILENEYFLERKAKGLSLQRLELFARNLEEGVLSWGNEPFRHQYCGRGQGASCQDGFWVPQPEESKGNVNPLAG